MSYPRRVFEPRIIPTGASPDVTSLGIELAPLPGYSPDLMPVEALWRWLGEDVTYHHCHAAAEDLLRGKDQPTGLFNAAGLADRKGVPERANV